MRIVCPFLCRDSFRILSYSSVRALDSIVLLLWISARAPCEWCLCLTTG
uniref:Uncharacterized protein n=1 Tax=Arundo donax TaxID=35708 RepID=A0A0A8ZIP7_ARUDO